MVVCLDTGTGTTFGNTDIYASNYLDPTPDAAAAASAPAAAAATAGVDNANGKGQGARKEKPPKGHKK
jgi:hypothetical protein